MFDGKVAVLGYDCAFAEDLGERSPGHPVARVYGIAAAIESLMSAHTTAQSERLVLAWLIEIAAAVIGVAWAITRPFRRRRAFFAALALAFLIGIGIGASTFAAWHYLWNPTIALVAMFAAMALASKLRQVHTVRLS